MPKFPLESRVYLKYTPVEGCHCQAFLTIRMSLAGCHSPGRLSLTRQTHSPGRLSLTRQAVTHQAGCHSLPRQAVTHQSDCHSPLTRQAVTHQAGCHSPPRQAVTHQAGSHSPVRLSLTSQTVTHQSDCHTPVRLSLTSQTVTHQAGCHSPGRLSLTRKPSLFLRWVRRTMRRARSFSSSYSCSNILMWSWKQMRASSLSMSETHSHALRHHGTHTATH